MWCMCPPRATLSGGSQSADRSGTKRTRAGRNGESEVGIDGSAWRIAVAGTLVASVPWVPLTVGIYALCLRVPLRRASWMTAVPIHLAGGTLVVLVRATWIHGLDPWIHWYPTHPSLWEVAMHSLQKNLFVYWLLVGVAHAMIHARAVIERERTAAELELEAALGRAGHRRRPGAAAVDPASDRERAPPRAVVGRAAWHAGHRRPTPR